MHSVCRCMPFVTKPNYKEKRPASAGRFLVDPKEALTHPSPRVQRLLQMASGWTLPINTTGDATVVRRLIRDEGAQRLRTRRWDVQQPLS